MGKGHCHIVFVRRFDYMVITDGAAGFRYVLHAAAMGPFDVVAKGEEGVAA